jgi:adenosylmethionine-8-amino-7-oxononanoate aminotransferase
MEMGVLFYPGHGGVDGVQGDHLMVAPPYVVTEGQIDTMVETLRQAIQQVAAATQGGRHSGIGSATTVID